MAKALKKITVSPGEPTKPVVKKTAGELPANLVFHQLILRNIDRSSKDVGEWRIAHRMAEAVLNPTRRRLWNLFKDVELDATIKGTWRKRVSAVANKKLYVSRNGKKDESFDELIKSKAFRRLRKKRMEEHSHGIIGFEFIPGEKFAWAEIPREHLRPEQQMVTIDVDGYTGFDYGQNPNIIVCEGEDPFGFLLYAAPYALFKKGNYSDWAQYVEIFGQPVVITKYDGYDEKTRSLLESALENAGSSLRLMLPKQADFEMLDGKTSNGDGRLQETFKNSLNNELLILILGNTETTTSDNGGSNAKSQVHAGQQLEITKDDMEEELMFFNDQKFLNSLQLFGFNTDGIEWLYETEVDSTELKAALEIDEKLEKIGLPLGHDYFYEQYHRPKPANYDELMQKKEQQRQAIINKPPTNNDDDNPDDTGTTKKKPGSKQKSEVAKALSGLSFWDKVKAVFSEAR
jgi:hypothetical protein